MIQRERLFLAEKSIEREKLNKVEGIKMEYNVETSQGKIIYKKARSFAKGSLEGLLGTFVLPTIIRKDHNCEMYKGDYRDTGRILGALSNVAGHMAVYLYLPHENDAWAFAPFVAANALSGMYEIGRWLIRKIKNRRKEDEK